VVDIGSWTSGKNRCKGVDECPHNEIYMKHAADGQRPLENNACIFIQTSGSFLGYHLVFYKKWKVLEERQFISGQVFVNKAGDDSTQELLPDLRKTREEGGIEIKAFLRYSNSNKEWIELNVRENAKGVQYINYSILFEKNGDDVRVAPSQDTEAEIIYIYSIPYGYFGSFLNRTISCFYEDAKICFCIDKALNDEDKKQLELNLFTRREGGPELLGLGSSKWMTKSGKVIPQEICDILKLDTGDGHIKGEVFRIKPDKMTWLTAVIPIEDLKKKGTFNAHLKWKSSSLFPGDTDTKDVRSSRITTK